MISQIFPRNSSTLFDKKRITIYNRIIPNEGDAAVCRQLVRVRSCGMLGVETDAPVSPAYLRVLGLRVRGRAALEQAAYRYRRARRKRLSDALQPACAATHFADKYVALCTS